MRVAIILIFGLVLNGCTLFYPSGTWRYRMTVEVETPEGLKIGSAVRQVHVQHEPKLLPEMHGFDVSVKGEAVVVDLGERGVLFALLGRRLAHSVVIETFPWPGGPGGSYSTEGLRYYAGLKIEKKEVALGQIPRLVTFKDMNNPESVELVYSSELSWQESKGSHKVYDVTDNFEAVFGKGVKLKRVWIEMTDDAVTKGVVDWLPWLPDYRNKLFDGRTTRTISAENRLANDLGMGSFSSGFPADWQLNQPSPAARRASPRPASE